MYLKIKNIDGFWDLREAKEIKYTGYHEQDSGTFPKDAEKPSEILDFSWGSYPDFINGILSKYALDKIEVFPNGYPRPIGSSRLLFGDKFAILDNKVAVVFTGEAYIINDSGKTIAKI